MSRLYATITTDARRTQPTARGHRQVTAAAQSWDGSIAVTLIQTDDATGPEVQISIGTGSTDRPGCLLWSGPLAALLAPGAALQLRRAEDVDVRRAFTEAVDALTDAMEWIGDDAADMPSWTVDEDRHAAAALLARIGAAVDHLLGTPPEPTDSE